MFYKYTYKKNKLLSQVKPCGMAKVYNNVLLFCYNAHCQLYFIL